MEMKSAYPDLTVLRRLESRFSTHYRKLNLPQRCPAVPKYPELLSALSKRNLAPRPFHQEDQPTVVPGNRLHWVQMPSKQRIIPAEVAVPCISRLNLHPSQTESCSRRNRCSNRYPILRRYKDLAPQRSWGGLSERVI